MLSPLQALIFGLIQGITELFPISSLGHSVVLPKLLGWRVDQKDPLFLTFLVATHTATALVLFIFFRDDWFRIIKGMFRSLRLREIRESDTDAKLAWLLVVATIPAGVTGLLFEDPLQNLFASPRLVAGVLVLNGCMLFLAETLKRKSVKKQQSRSDNDSRIARLTWLGAIKVGLLQCLALIPGFSRTGATMTGGLIVGLTHEDAARYAFLLATPIIAAASLLKLPDLLTQGGQRAVVPSLIGAITAAAAAYFSVKFLTKFFEKGKLWMFGAYCIAIGAIVSILFL